MNGLRFSNFFVEKRSSAYILLEGEELIRCTLLYLEQG